MDDLELSDQFVGQILGVVAGILFLIFLADKVG